MLIVFVPLVLTVLLSEPSASLSSSGTETRTACPTRWLLIGQRCFAFYPVWSSWSSAESLCSQVGGNLASLHIPEERELGLQLLSTHTSVWLGGYQAQKNGSWLWSDDSPFSSSSWTNQTQEVNGEGGACLQMEPKSGELHSAPCGELSFYICSTRVSSQGFTSDRKPVEPEVVPGASLFDVVWSYSDVLADEILCSSSFIKQLRSGQLTQRCYSSFIQQEALYLHRVSSTLEALITRLQEADDVTSLLLDTLKHYSSRNQSLLSSPPPPWLLWPLQSFHSVVLEEPVYFLVALSARSSLQSLLTRDQELRSGSEQVSESKTEHLYKEWREESVKEAAWTQRYKKLLEEHRDKMDVFKAVNIFRQHMLNQKSFYKSLDCDVEDDR
uniref:uncharacterized protein isoform X2 n=1 Tax=Semicossyphus pulcher TaxID=241346 RepID=UPI0037E940EF